MCCVVPGNNLLELFYNDSVNKENRGKKERRKEGTRATINKAVVFVFIIWFYALLTPCLSFIFPCLTECLFQLSGHE